MTTSLIPIYFIPGCLVRVSTHHSRHRSVVEATPDPAEEVNTELMKTIFVREPEITDLDSTNDIINDYHNFNKYFNHHDHLNHDNNFSHYNNSASTTILATTTNSASASISTTINIPTMTIYINLIKLILETRHNINIYPNKKKHQVQFRLL